MDHFEANGGRMPRLGFGTYRLTGDIARDRVSEALATGYRHIDTAQMYDNESEVGAGLQASGVDREAIWLTTKVWVDRFANGDLQRSAEESLQRLGTDYVDLLLLHWPNPDVPLAETMEALNDVRRRGLAKHIGVSNFTVDLVRQAVAASEAPLFTNQVEYHPRLSQQPVLAELERQNMALTAFCPLGQGKVVNDPALARIAETHDRNPAQIILRWHYQQPRVVAIPGSSSVAHLKSNFDILDFELSEDEMRAIHGLASEQGRIVKPENLAPAWDNAA